jgi:hypothetical protein
MFLNASHLKHHVASSVNGRYALASIALTEHGAMSTDGHSLMFTPYPELDPQDAPKIDGVNPAAPPPVAEPFLLSPADAAKAAAMLGRATRSAPAWTRVVQAEVKDDSVVLGTTDLQNAQVMRVKGVQGQYPEVGAVIPDYDKAATVSINIDQLLRSLKALKGATDSEVVTVRVIDDQHAVGFSCKDGTAMLVMPIQVNKPEDHVPCQLAKIRTGDFKTPEQPPEQKPAPEPAPDPEDDFTPTPDELEDAQSVHDSQPVIPEPEEFIPEPAAQPRTRRRKPTPNPQDELHAILSG